MIESSDDFESAYRLHAQGIYRFLLWRTQNNELAEDLTSSVFEKAWRSRRSFQGGSVQAWLYRIARNTLIDHWRKRHDLPVADTEMLEQENSDIDIGESLDKQAAAEELQKALARLPDEMRAVVTLRFVSGLSAREVAQRLRLSEGNVRVMQYRALQKLRGYLQ